MHDSNVYRTSDLYYAAYLKVAQVPFIEAKRDKGRVYFYFEDEQSSLRNDLKQDYYNRSGKVAAMTYADEIKAMKALVHEVGSES